MNQPIEGLREEPKIDGRTREARAQRAALRSDGIRPEAHAETRPDSVRAAELRAQVILDSLEGSGGAGGNELDIPANLAPEGWEYELKRVSVAGQEDRHHQLGLLRVGWTPVPASRHPWLMPAGYEGPIQIKGLMLMEKPKILVDRARENERREAMDQLRNSEAALREAPPNTAPRDHPKLVNATSHELMRPVGAGDKQEGA